MGPNQGGAFGIGLADNVKQAYRAICKEFRRDDKLFLFGFSRGAYTARSLAGLIGLCGIANLSGNDNDRHCDDVTNRGFDIYRKDPNSKNRRDAAECYIKKYAHQDESGALLNEIHFIGVWDTVGALGIPIGWFRWFNQARYKFHDPTLGSHTRHAYHALAIDERRGPFVPTKWRQANATKGQVVEQLWFPGVHSNIGGGYVDTGLSDRAFLWMCLKARDAGLGLRADYMNLRVNPNYHGELRDSRKGGYMLLPPAVRRIGESNVAGEGIHYSARDRFCHATESSYRNGSAKENLGPVLRKKKVRTMGALCGEINFHRGLGKKFWGGYGSPESFG